MVAQRVGGADFGFVLGVCLGGVSFLSWGMKDEVGAYLLHDAADLRRGHGHGVAAVF